ncbi:MAG: LLM class F420-dependent oxidoreductase [Actinomycetia bacterium]|nr:LLM class F420-dependent oxidoreductase [Actinomycetes bacterium]
MTTPKLALFGINMGTMADPSVMVTVTQAAEAAGYESVWTGEHIVLPDPQAPPSPAAPETPMVDTAVALAYLAASTSTIRLGSGIIILPQRQPAVLAKSLASLDHMPGGRLMFGLGVGYLEAEMTACGVPMAGRGGRADEYLRAIRALWSDDAVTFDGEFVSLDGVTAYPKPAQAAIPIVAGGHSRAAVRRAIETAHGWYGFMRDVETTAADLALLAEMADSHERPAELGKLEISITPAGRLKPGHLEAYAELGVDRLILQPGGHRNLAELLEYVDQYKPAS